MGPQVAVSVLGTDRPGIVCEVASLLAEANCNIDDLTQTVLQDEFAGIFLVSLPQDTSPDLVQNRLKEGLLPLGIVPYVKEVQTKEKKAQEQSAEPFVVVCIGQDQVGLIAAVTCVMKGLEVNITNLNSVPGSSAFVGQVVTIFEVDVPEQTPLNRLSSALQEIAARKDIQVTIQHKRIFEDICRL